MIVNLVLALSLGSQVTCHAVPPTPKTDLSQPMPSYPVDVNTTGRTYVFEEEVCVPGWHQISESWTISTVGSMKACKAMGEEWLEQHKDAVNARPSYSCTTNSGQ